jgi:hypothetical protein
MLTGWAPSWRPFLKSSKNLRKGWLVTAGIVALYLGAIHPSERARGINNSRATGLAAYDSEPLGLWRQARLSLQQQTSVDRSEVTDDPVGGQQTIAYLSATPTLDFP